MNRLEPVSTRTVQRKAADGFPRTSTEWESRAEPQADGSDAEANPRVRSSSPLDLEPPAETEPLVDFQQLANYVGFVLGATTRRKLLMFAVFTAMLVATAAGVYVWPKTYHAGAILLAQRNETMAELSNPGRTISRLDGPANAAAANVLRHENLVSLMKQTGLLGEWDRTRSPILKFRDSLLTRLKLKPKQTDDERLDALEGLLEQRLKVGIVLDGTITFDVDWSDARLAYEIIETAVQNFLESRQVAETSIIADSVSILERSAAAADAEVSKTLADTLAEHSKRSERSEIEQPRTVRAAPKPSPAMTPAAAALAALEPPKAGAPEIAYRVSRLRTALESKRQEISRLNEFRSQQLLDLQSQLTTARTIYTDGHPAVASLQASIASMSRESPQLTGLRNEAQNLETEYEAAFAAQQADEQRVLFANRTAAAQAEVAKERAAAAQVVEEAPPPPVRIERSSAIPGLSPDIQSPSAVRLRLGISQLGDLRARLEAARIELASSQAGFKYRYSVVRPAQVPRRAAKPKVPLILAAGFLAACGLAVGAAVAADVLSDRFLESWQIERLAGAPILARLRQP